MGRQGGARRPRRLCARCAARTLGASLRVCARPASRAPSRSPPPPPPRLPPPALPSPSRRSSRGRHGSRAARLCPVLPCPGGEAGERAREYGQRGYTRERMRAGSGGGSQSLWSHRSPVCKEWCVCECARVRACGAVGGGVPGVLQHHTESPARREGNPSGGTAAAPTLNPSAAGRRPSRPPAAPALPASAPARRLRPGVGSGIRPPAAAARSGPAAAAADRKALRPARRSQKRLS